MNNEVLIIVPGVGDPNFGIYKELYDEHANKAKNNFNYAKVIVPTFIGHKSHNIQGFLNIQNSSKILRKIILQLERNNTKYSIFCHSLGCSVFFELYRLKTVSFSYLDKCVFWAPTPYFMNYKLEVLTDESLEAEQKKYNCRFSKKTFDSVFPFELYIKEFNNDINLRIGTGSLDKICSPYFLEFLNKIFLEKKIIYKVFDNYKHSVFHGSLDYYKFILL